MVAVEGNWLNGTDMVIVADVGKIDDSCATLHYGDIYTGGFLRQKAPSINNNRGCENRLQCGVSQPKLWISSIAITGDLVSMMAEAV
jgi:hypothetical protein